MQTIQSSRRGFLTNLAVLTAGTVWGSAVSPFFSESHVVPGPESTWQAICTLYKSVPGKLAIKEKKELQPCKGHTHEEGPLVYFPAEKISAQPVWIYWAGRKRPSDLIVHFYKQDDSIITLNQYELQSLLRPENAAQKSGNHPITALLKINDNGQRVLITQTSVYRNKTRTVYIS